MPLLENDILRERVKVIIPSRAPYNVTKEQKLENIESFCSLSREGLLNGEIEKRVLLYETINHEKLYLQYPGIESVRDGNNRYPNDARPVLKKADGSYLADMDFKKIWDVIDNIGQDYHRDIDILATVFLSIAFMYDYQHIQDNVLCEKINVNGREIIGSEHIRFVWNRLFFERDVFETLNDRFRLNNGISLEAFLYYNDLLAQNEDCKYKYLKRDNWDIKMGRINNCLSHLTIISHINGAIGISKLIDSFQRTGVAPLPISRLEEACNDLVVKRR